MAFLISLVCVCTSFPGSPAEPRFAMAHGANFVVTAPTQELADQILAKSESLRREIALEWLGYELPPSVGMTSIRARLSETVDENRTLAADERSRMNMMWLTTSRDKLTGSALAHEITHTVFATEFRGRLPAWADEGVAGLRDDAQREAVRRRTVEWFVRSGNWPLLQETLDALTIMPADRSAYAVAVSLTEYLLSRGDRATLLRCAVDGKQNGWSRALSHHYGIASVARLQADWQAWVSRSVPTQSATVAPRSGR